MSIHGIYILNVLITLFFVCKFLDTAFLLRMASEHEDVSSCAKSISFGLAHMLMLLTCYFNTAAWIKFALTLKTLARSTESTFDEKYCFLKAGFAVAALLVIAMNTVFLVNDCYFPEQFVEVGLPEYIGHLVAYIITTAIFFHTASYLRRCIRQHFPSFEKRSGNLFSRALLAQGSLLVFLILK